VLEVVGPEGVGKSTLVRRAVGGFPSLAHRAPPLPDPAQRSALLHSATAGLAALGTGPPEAEPGQSWDQILSAVVRALPDRGAPLVLILDDAHRLVEARSRFQEPLAQALAATERLHVVLLAPTPVIAQGDPLSPHTALRMEVGPLPFRAALPLLPGASARERLVAYAVFGGSPRHLGRLDPHVGLQANVRRSILDEGAPLSMAGIEPLERTFQAPSRYAAILRALCPGEAGWRKVHEGVPDLGTSGQLAPYMRKLESMGLVEVRQSLDAKPGTRSRRYRIRDPFHAFWFRHVLPTHHGMPGDVIPAARGELRTTLLEHARSILPSVCRQFMSSDAMERLGHNARECGSLWGSDYEIPAAGILTSGAAFYGHVFWNGPAVGSVLDQLDSDVRNTRYGFGRETRLRLVFSATTVSMALERQVAQRYDAEIIRLEDLAGSS
jgi:hypothetical protein